MSLNSKSIESQFNLNEVNSNLESIYEFENFRLDAARMMLYENGREVELAPKVVETLLALIESRGEIVSKQEMMNRLWADSFVEDANLTQNIYLLRKTLGKGADGRDLIETFRRRGYRFNGETKTPEQLGMSVTPSAESPVITEEIGAKAKKTTETGAVSGVLSRQKRSKTLWVAGAIISGLLIVSLAVFIVNKLRSGTSFQNKPIDSIAVMPFVNESSNADLEYLSDGMTETLIGSLSQIPKLNVKARASVFRYKGKETNAKQIGADLNVQAVLTGRVVQRGDDLTLFLNLVDATTENNLWSKQYNRKLSNLVVLQTEIARDVASNLRAKLSGADERRVTKRYTESAEAYELYLKGRFFAGGRITEEGLKKSIEYYQQAIEKDPNYALAYAGLGMSYKRLGHVWGFRPPRETFPKAKVAIMKALEIDETLADAHAALGDYYLSFEWDWSAAERELKRAIELDPDNISAHWDYASYFESIERFDEAIAEIKLCRELDPLSPTATANVGYPYYYARQHDKAIEYYRKALELDPNYSWSYLWIGQAYVEKKMYDEAIAEINKAIALSEGNMRMKATLGYAYARAGRRGEAQKIIGELQEQSKQRYVSPYFIAVVYSGLGEKDKALESLEKAYQERHPYLAFLKVEPVFDNLRDDPRFQDLLRRVGFQQ